MEDNVDALKIKAESELRRIKDEREKRITNENNTFVK